MDLSRFESPLHLRKRLLSRIWQVDRHLKYLIKDLQPLSEELHKLKVKSTFSINEVKVYFYIMSDWYDCRKDIINLHDDLSRVDWGQYDEIKDVVFDIWLCIQLAKEIQDQYIHDQLIPDQYLETPDQVTSASYNNNLISLVRNLRVLSLIDKLTTLV